MTSEEKHPSLLPGRWYRVTSRQPDGGLKLQVGGSPGTPLLNFQWKKHWGGCLDTDVLGVIGWNPQENGWLCISLANGGSFVRFSAWNLRFVHLKNVSRKFDKTRNLPDDVW